MAQKNRKGQEKLRGKIVEMVKRNQKTLRAASLELGLSYSCRRVMGTEKEWAGISESPRARFGELIQVG